MVEKCGDKSCVPICDHCEYYDFNGDDGVYVGDGYCRKHNEPSEPYMECTDFKCFLVNKN